MGGATPSPSALERTLELIDPARRPHASRSVTGYLDLLGERGAAGSHPGQRLMESAGLARIYEDLWRPLWGRVFMGASGPGMRDERRVAVEMMGLSTGHTVLDVGCGPGNFTREFGRAAGGEGLVVGIDASESMLSRAVQEAAADNVAYVRGDAATLPFRDESFNAVCCFAALYLIEEPFQALDEIVRVLAPGGRVALLSTTHRGLLPARVTDAFVRRLSGVRIFGRDELTEALRERGLTSVGQRVSGLAQFVSGAKPPG
jgi:ubiquinone/menaquinone biosynthesis C-methylase UbiE